MFSGSRSGIELVVGLRELGRLVSEKQRDRRLHQPCASACCWSPRIERAITSRWISLVPS